jgi:hypothetical protein
MMENQLTPGSRDDPMSFRMFATESTTTMTTRTYADQAIGMAGATRVRAFRPCPASPAVAVWSPMYLGTTNDKHGRPRRLEVSHL